MEVKFNVTKEERKALVKAISEVVGLAPVYLGAPDFKFAVGSCVIDRNGTAMIGEGAGAEDVRVLLAGLAERGFVFEGDIDEIVPAISGQNDAGADESGDESVVGVANHDDNDAVKSEGEPDGDAVSVTAETVGDRLSVNIPLFGFTASSLDNLEKLVAAKAWILKKMAGTDELPVKRDEKHLYFPWFRRDASAAEIDAYVRLIARLCETAKEKRRVTATERRPRDGDNEKFKARCFLLSLGFIGKETAQARRILLAPMSGNGSHKSGDHKKQGAPTSAAAAESGAKNPDAVHARRGGPCAHDKPVNAENGGYRDCLACACSFSEPAENDGDPDKLFCQEFREYVAENGYCDEFNC
jgi:hypothetical protein